MAVRYASTVISFAPPQRQLAHALARELTRRGVVPWIDTDDAVSRPDDDTEVHSLDISTEDPLTADVGATARRAATALYEGLMTRSCKQLVVHFDQRDRGGRRIGAPVLGNEWGSCPALVFRPDQGERSQSEVVVGTDWEALRDTIQQALGDATGSRQMGKVYVNGKAQLALAWLAGHFFDRSNHTELVAYNLRGAQYLGLDFGEARFRQPLAGSEPPSTMWHDEARSVDATEVSIYIGDASYAKFVHRHRAATGDSTPLAILPSGLITTTDEVIDIARWMIAASDGRPVRLYTGLPFHAVVLLSALRKHATGPITFMEWDLARSTYHACLMPRG